MLQFKETNNYQFWPSPKAFEGIDLLPHVSVRQFDNDLSTCPFRKQVHRHKFFEVAWLSRGELWFFIDFKIHHLTAGSLVFISPGQVHTLDGDRDEVGLTIISFAPDLFSLYGTGVESLTDLPFYYTTVPPLLPVESTHRSTFDNLFAMVDQKSQFNSPRQSQMLCAYLNLIFLEALGLYETTPAQNSLSASTQLTHNFRLATERHFIERKQVQEYAEILGVTANHLVKSVRETTGMTPGHMLNIRLALEAKRLLVHTTESAAEIAHKLAFKNPSQFGRWFRNIEGISPGQFREQFLVPRAMA